MASDLSPLDVVRRRYDDLRGGQTPTLHLPVLRGVDGLLVVEYNEPDWPETQEIRNRWAGDDQVKAPLYAQAEQLAVSCVDIHIRDDANGVPIKGLDGNYLPGLGRDNGVVGFHAAASILGRPTSDEDPIQAVWAVLLSDWEVDRHGRLLALWEPRVASPEVEASFAGESEPAAP